jgi:glycosyltransferase involved in cell wall biosynthesis
VRVLIVTETADAWPSGYVRALIYKDLFRRDGIDVVYASRLVPALTRMIEDPPRGMRRLIAGPARRPLLALHALTARRRERNIARMAEGADLIYLQKVGSPGLVRALKAGSRARIVYDLNDGLWLPSRAAFAQGGIGEILGLVDAVTCDNPHGLAYARSMNPSCYLVPDPSQVERFDERRPSATKTDSPFVIGWIGSRGTAFNLFLIWEALERVFARHPDLELRILGTGGDSSVLPPFEKVRYSLLPAYTQAQMIEEVSRMQVGLFPLFDVEDSLARGFLKGEIYWSGEAALLTSPVGQCRDLVRDGVNGMVARSTAEWEQKLEALIADASLRRQLAREGLATVREQFSLERCYRALKAALLGEQPGSEDMAERASPARHE